MFAEWFDGRFHAAGARSHRLSSPRMMVGAGLWLLIGLSIGWETAGYWGLAALAAEWPMRAVTRPMRRGDVLTPIESFICIAAWFALVSVWSAAGAILWCSASPACQLAGVAVFAAQILYVEAHHGRSLAAMIPALPALAAPVVAPLAAPHFKGAGQVLVVATLAALAAHGAVSLWQGYREGLRLKAAEAETDRLTAEMIDASAQMMALTAAAMRRAVAGPEVAAAAAAIPERTANAA